MMRAPRLLLLLATALLAAPASGVTVNVALDQLIASGLGDCTASPPGQCTGTPPDPPVEINSIAGHWGNGLPYDEALLPQATLGPVEMTLPGSIALPMPASFAFLAGGTGGGSGGPDPGVCPPAGQGGVLRSLSFTRSVTVNGVQKSFQQTGSVRVGWCWDVFTLNPASVPVDTAQGTVTVNVAGAAPVVSNGPTTVSLTSPVAGASFAGNVPLAATASVTIGAINKVEFYRGTTLVATVLSPPYTASDAGVPPGSYSYSAKAYNDEDPNEIFLLSTVATVTVTGAVAQQMYFIQTDHLNTPRMIANQAGTTVWRWDNTEPFGNSMPNDDPDGDGVPFVFDLRFPGQYFDRETGLAHNYFRDYDSAIARYVQSDPVGLRGGLNTYAYVNDNPLLYVDPRGETKADVEVGIAVIRQEYPNISIPDITYDNLWPIPIIAPNPRANTSLFTRNVTLDNQFLACLDDGEAQGMLITLLHEMLHHNQSRWQQIETVLSPERHDNFNFRAASMLSAPHLLARFHQKRKEANRCVCK